MKKRYGVAKLITTSVATALLLGGFSPAMAGAGDEMSKADLYKMIQELQGEVKALKSDRGQGTASNRNIRSIVAEEVAAQVPEAEESLMDRIQIHGSLSQGWLKSDHNDWYGETEKGTFNFNEVAFNISADLTDKLRAGLQIMSRDLGEYVNNEVRLDWAVLDYAWMDQLGLRAGKLKVPMGMYNESRDIDGARIAVLLPQGFYNENAREIWNNVMGAGIYGNFDLRRAGSLSYTMVYGDSDLDKEGETASIAEGRGFLDAGSTSSLIIDHLFSGSLTWDTPLEGLRLNTTYQRANMHMTGNKTIPVGPAAGTYSGNLDLNNIYSWSVGSEYTWNDLVLAGELKRARLPADFTAGPIAAGAVTRPLGWYLSGAYRFSDLFAAEVSYSEFYPDSDDKNGDGAAFTGAPGAEKFYAWQKIWSFNGRFDINGYWTVKAGVNFNDGMSTAFGFQNDDEANDQRWILYQLKTTVSF